MINSIDYSVFLSTFEKQKEQFASLYKEGNFIFTSFHISEEYDNSYIQRAKDRYIAPYAAFISLLSYNIDGVFIGDGIITQFQANMISQYLNSNIYTLPVIFEKEYEYLYNKVFTIRTDSPRWLKRLQESRENGTTQDILPNHCTERTTGSITIDNNRYQRYSGEIQIIAEDLPADERVNVIGQLPREYHLLLKNIMNGSKIRFVKPMEESKMFQKEQGTSINSRYILYKKLLTYLLSSASGIRERFETRPILGTGLFCYCATYT